MRKRRQAMPHLIFIGQWKCSANKELSWKIKLEIPERSTRLVRSPTFRGSTTASIFSLSIGIGPGRGRAQLLAYAMIFGWWMFLAARRTYYIKAIHHSMVARDQCHHPMVDISPAWR